RPDLSAGEPAPAWQKATLLLLLPVFAVTAAAAPEQAVFMLAAVLVLPFFCVVVLRTAALWHTSVGSRPARSIAAAAPEPAVLPHYSLLVPLYDEAHIVPDLVAALRAIDYPQDRMEALLILESVDAKTLAAVRAAPLPPNIRVVVVPDGSPRT